MTHKPKFEVVCPDDSAENHNSADHTHEQSHDHLHSLSHEIFGQDHTHTTEPVQEECKVVPVKDPHTGSVSGVTVVCDTPTEPAQDSHPTPEPIPEPVCVEIPITDPHTGHVIGTETVCDIPDATPAEESHLITPATQEPEPVCEVVPIVDTHTGQVVDATVVCDTP